VKRLAYRLRTLADRIDPEGAPRRTNLSFTFEDYKGIVVDMDGRRGCPLWYYGMADYERAHAESQMNAKEPPRSA